MGFDLSSAFASSAMDMLGREIGAQRDYGRSRRFRQTQYQDTMADMKKAGLNPILAGQVGGNTSAHLASATGSVGSSAVNAGINSALAKKNIELMEQQRIKSVNESNYFKGLAERERLGNWFLEYEQDLTGRRAPSERAAADFIGMNPEIAQMNSALSLFAPAGNAAANALKLLPAGRFSLMKGK